MNGPPSIFGFLTAAACTCGALRYGAMIRRCRPVMFFAAVAGGMRCAQAYHWSTSGSTCTLGFRYIGSSVMVIPQRFIDHAHDLARIRRDEEVVSRQDVDHAAPRRVRPPGLQIL